MMDRLITCARMRALEQEQIDSGVVDGAELMERAGQGVVRATLAHWPELSTGTPRAVVLCGPGNNGGDGFVVARLLHGRGWRVEVLFAGKVAGLADDARANHDAWCALGPVAPLDAAALAGDFDLVIDALFGIGLSRPIDGLTGVMAAVADTGARKVAIDLPSGLSGDSGRVLCDDPADQPVSAFRADLTVTFHAAKPGHVLEDGPSVCGALTIVDIGLPDAPDGDVSLVGPPEGLTKRAGHKFGHGHALVLTGGAGRTGAARLAARGAQRIGAGLVTLGVPPSAQFEVAAQITSAMLTRVADGAALTGVLEDGRINALCLGPGMGVNARGHALVDAALAGRRSTVLDADALSVLVQDDTLFARLHGDCVLTPHGGEFARLFPDLMQEHSHDRTRPKTELTRRAAERAGCVVLFKGADTVIAAPDGRCAIHAAVYHRAAPWLATAGAGDVLAGLIAGLLARGLAPFEAACTAAFLHVECALAFGPGLIAEDLPEALPGVLRHL